MTQNNQLDTANSGANDDSTIYPWHQSVLAHITALLLANRLPHACLFRRRPGYFDSALGLQIAQRILCDTQRGCQHCQHCRLMVASNHPNCLFLDAVSDKVGIDDIRRLEQQMWQTAMFNKPKVAFICGLDLLGIAAQNALLKTLEEPPKNAIFILSVENLSRVLPTIISRVQSLHHQRLDSDSLFHWLQRQSGNEAMTEAAIAAIVKLADFAPARSLELLQSPALVEELNSEKRRFAEFISGNIPVDGLALIQDKASNKALSKANAEAQLQRYCRYTDDTIRFLFAKSQQTADNRGENSVKYPTWKGVSLRDLYSLRDALNGLRRLATTNVNLPMQLTTSLTDWQNDQRKLKNSTATPGQ